MRSGLLDLGSSYITIPDLLVCVSVYLVELKCSQSVRILLSAERLDDYIVFPSLEVGGHTSHFQNVLSGAMLEFDRSVTSFEAHGDEYFPSMLWGRALEANRTLTSLDLSNNNLSLSHVILLSEGITNLLRRLRAVELEELDDRGFEGRHLSQNMLSPHR